MSSWAVMYYQFDSLFVTNKYHIHVFVEEIKLVKQKSTEETKTDTITRKSTTKHETRTRTTETPSAKNNEDPQIKDFDFDKPISKVNAHIEPSDEEDVPKNRDVLRIKEITRLSKEKVNDAVSTSEYETESYPIESPTDDDVEKSILDFDSDVEPRIHSVQQKKSLERKINIDASETKVSPKFEKETKVCKLPSL
jgi:hypothetical protein